MTIQSEFAILRVKIHIFLVRRVNTFDSLTTAFNESEIIILKPISRKLSLEVAPTTPTQRT